MIEPARDETATAAAPDVRLGSATNAVRPILAAERSLAAGSAQWLSLLAVAGTALFADQLTKQIIARTLAVGEKIDIVGPFSIRHVENSGIAFGFFSSRTTVVIAVTSIAVAWMLWFFARSARRHPVLPVALGLVLGGSVANLVDRIRLGHVTDFLDLEAWPAFNLADTFIVVGVAVLFGALVLADRPRRTHGAGDGNAALHRR
jgi:signal peptidase II